MGKGPWAPTRSGSRKSLHQDRRDQKLTLFFSPTLVCSWPRSSALRSSLQHEMEIENKGTELHSTEGHEQKEKSTR